MKHHPIYFLATAALFFALASCCPCRKAVKHPVPLVGTEWVLTEMDGKPAAGRYTLTLDRQTGRYQGRTSCNSYSGEFTLPGTKQVSFGDAVSTRVYCQDAGFESRFLAGLGEIDAYTIDGTVLVLIRRGDVVYVFERPSVTIL